MAGHRAPASSRSRTPKRASLRAEIRRRTLPLRSAPPHRVSQRQSNGNRADGCPTGPASAYRWRGRLPVSAARGDLEVLRVAVVERSAAAQHRSGVGVGGRQVLEVCGILRRGRAARHPDLLIMPKQILGSTSSRNERRASAIDPGESRTRQKINASQTPDLLGCQHLLFEVFEGVHR